MDTQIVTRRPFEVKAVQVTPQNATEVAKWCGGKVGQSIYKLAGFETPLPTVLVPGNGPNAGQMVEARIGSYITQHGPNFRVWRKRQFHENFVAPDNSKLEEKLNELLQFNAGDLVQDKDESDGIWQGRVVFTGQVLVEYPFKGNVLHEPDELIKIDKFNDETEKRYLLAAEAQKDIPHEAVEKINALRTAAEAAIGDGLTLPPVNGSLEEPPTEVNGMKVGDAVVVRNELAEFFSDTGEIVKILSDTMLLVQLDAMEDGDKFPPVKFLHDEIQLLTDMKFVRIINVDSDQNGWVGWVIQDAPVGEALRVAFRSNILGHKDKCFSFMNYEVEEYDLGAEVPRYELPA